MAPPTPRRSSRPGEADHERRASAEHDAREDVAPEVVGAEQVRVTRRVARARRLEALADVLLDGIEGGDPGRAHRGDHHHRHHHEAEERGAAAREPAHEQPPLTAGRAEFVGQRQRRRPRAHDSRIRGSRYVYTMSTKRLTSTKVEASRKTAAWTTG